MPDSAIVSWPADRIERQPLAKLIPYARNARKHSPAQISEIAGLIREFGWTFPVLVDEDNRIIAGHGRVLAAHQLAITEIPTIVARGWTDAQKRAYTIADNEIAAHATWNKELLRLELADLQASAFDLEKIGFAAAAIQEDAETEELPRALQLEPAREYALIVCANADEWERLKVALSLTPVRRGGYKKGSAFDATGTQRVVLAAEFLAIIEDAA